MAAVKTGPYFRVHVLCLACIFLGSEITVREMIVIVCFFYKLKTRETFMDAVFSNFHFH